MGSTDAEPCWASTWEIRQVWRIGGLCEDCKETRASYGLAMEWSLRWCANCCPQDAVSLHPESFNTLVCDHARELYLSGLPPLIGQPPSAPVYSAVRCKKPSE